MTSINDRAADALIANRQLSNAVNATPSGCAGNCNQGRRACDCDGGIGPDALVSRICFIGAALVIFALAMGWLE